jgi:methylenetetrahydrofolate--tRNA-(uracil-5-)-methyltransferase
MTFDLLEPLEEEVRKKVRDKKERHRLQCERALGAFDAWRAEAGYRFGDFSANL